MFPIEYQSYHDIFSNKLKKCKSKKDYKKLCKEMVFQFGVIDKIDANQGRILSSLVGTDKYLKVITLAIKMYLLEKQGLPCDIISFEEETDNFDI